MSQAAVHDSLEAFIAELATADTSVVLRERIAGSFQRWTGATGVWFFERAVEAHYACTLPVGSATSIDGRGPLPRWLRVNDEVLEFRNRPDVVSYLSSDERAYVERIGGHACVPMVHGSALVAFLFLCEIEDLNVLSRRRPLLEAYATRAAELWRHVTLTEEQQARQSALGHSHRLGITGQVAASVAHEVRNPLAAVRSLVQFVQDTPLAPEERESILGDVLEEVDRIDQTVTGMLQLSQPPLSERQVIDLSELVRSVFRFVRAYAHRRGVTLTVELPEQPIQVHGDGRELRQVVTNLLLNACQACDGGGRVVTTVRNGAFGDRLAEIEVSDTGAGIAPEHLPRVFEPFFTTKPQGTGLGLPYCRDVAERHGGTVALESRLAEGTIVRVRLPLLEADELGLGG